MKYLGRLILFCALSFSSLAHAQQMVRGALPAAPIPQPTRLDKALWTADLAVRQLDVVSTQRFLQCTCNHEAIMPKWAVESPGVMSAWELGASLGVAWQSRRLLRAGHPRLARTLALADVVGVGMTVAHNYTLRAR